MALAMFSARAALLTAFLALTVFSAGGTRDTPRFQVKLSNPTTSEDSNMQVPDIVSEDDEQFEDLVTEFQGQREDQVIDNFGNSPDDAEFLFHASIRPTDENVVEDSDEPREGAVNAEVTELSRILYFAANLTLSLQGGIDLEEDVAQFNKMVMASPFTWCLLPSAQIDELAKAPAGLVSVGKLAKGGSFMTTASRATIIKSVPAGETQVLKTWVEKDMVRHYFGSCDKLSESLLVPVPLVVPHRKLSYLVMPNATYWLEKASKGMFSISHVYDIKPLPNLSEGLVQMLRDMREGWGYLLPRLQTWQGWTTVRNLLHRDLELLEDSKNQLGFEVVDFSLFVHVLEREPHFRSDVPELTPQKGCIEEPQTRTFVCFKLLDYLTAYSSLRQWESYLKKDKFVNYAQKTLHAFDCIGNLKANSCDRYSTYTQVKEAIDSNKNEKLAFIGSPEFRDNYRCSLQMPVTIGNKVGMKPASLNLPRFDEGDSIGVRKRRSYAQYLYHLVRQWATTYSEAADAEVGPDFAEALLVRHESAKFEAARRVAAWPLEDLRPCINGIHNFATQTWGLHKEKKYLDLNNVLWLSHHDSVLVARGNPTGYSHSTAVKKMHANKCYLRTYFFDCSMISESESSTRVQLTYNKHFSQVQVMQVFSYRYSTDLADLQPRRP